MDNKFIFTSQMIIHTFAHFSVTKIIGRKLGNWEIKLTFNKMAQRFQFNFGYQYNLQCNVPSLPEKNVSGSTIETESIKTKKHGWQHPKSRINYGEEYIHGEQ